MIAMSEEQVYECLADAGCGKELIKQFEACQHSGSQKITAASCWRGFIQNRRSWTSWIIWFGP